MGVSTSIFSWLRSILFKYCLLWAQAQNTNVNDGLGKQINKQANIDCSFMFVYMSHMCLLLMPNKPDKTYLTFCVYNFSFFKMSFDLYHHMMMLLIVLINEWHQEVI